MPRPKQPPTFGNEMKLFIGGMTSIVLFFFFASVFSGNILPFLILAAALVAIYGFSFLLTWESKATRTAKEEILNGHLAAIRGRH